MKKESIISLFLLIIISFFLTNSCNLRPKEDVIVLRLDWFLNMSFAGEVIALKEVSKKHDVEFKIAAATENIDPIKMVLSGQNNFGVVSADKFLAAIERGAEIVAIGVKNQISPVVFLSKKEKGIVTPNDFKNKRIGVLPGGSTEFVYRTLLQKNSISTSDLIEVNIPFDLATFITGRYDVRPAFIYDEPIVLEREEIEFNILNPVDFGVRYIGGVYFTTKRLINSNPELVKSFVEIMAESWEIALSNPEHAINLLKEADSSINFDRELLSLKKGLNYFKTDENQVLIFNRENWETMIRNLYDIGILQEKLDFERITNETFIIDYYKKL